MPLGEAAYRIFDRNIMLNNDKRFYLPIILCIFAPDMKYKVTIRETLERTLDVEANSAQEAELSVRQDYHNSIIVLDDGDYVDTWFEVKPIIERY